MLLPFALWSPMLTTTSFDGLISLSGFDTTLVSSLRSLVTCTALLTTV